MHKLRAILKFLTSLWGLLASAAVLFPGAAALLKIPIAVENSQIKQLYVAIGTIIAAFSLLLLISYRDTLGNLSRARIVALVSALLALLTLFGFLGMRIFVLDVRTTAETAVGGKFLYEAKDRGIILKETGRRIIEDENSYRRETESKEQRGDPWDLLALFLFTITLSSLTVAFGSLGIHSYQETEKHSGKKKPKSQVPRVQQ